MKKTGLVLFSIILIFAIATGMGIHIKSVSNFEPKREFVYAADNIPAKTIITAKMLTTKSKDISDGHKLSVTDANDIIGKKATVNIVKDEMLLSSRFVDPNDKTLEIQLRNKDNRKFTVEFKPDQAVGWCLSTDQYVDILFIPNPGLDEDQKQTVYSAAGEKKKQAVATTPEEAKKQIALGYNAKKNTRMDHIRIAGIIDESGNVIDGKAAVIPKYICFEVNKEQDIFLAWAKSNGRIEVSAIPQDNEIEEGK